MRAVGRTPLSLDPRAVRPLLSAARLGMGFGDGEIHGKAGDGVVAGTRDPETGNNGVCGRKVQGWVAACEATTLSDWSGILGGDRS